MTYFQPVQRELDILGEYRETPIGELLRSHNLRTSRQSLYETPQLTIVTCLDPRVVLSGLPGQFAFQLRTGGAAFEPVLPNIAFTLSVIGVRAIAVIDHTDCAMCRAVQSRDQYISHLTDHGWSADAAERSFGGLRESFAIDDPVEAEMTRASQLASLFPHCLVAPLLFDVADGSLQQLRAE